MFIDRSSIIKFLFKNVAFSFIHFMTIPILLGNTNAQIPRLGEKRPNTEQTTKEEGRQ